MQQAGLSLVFPAFEESSATFYFLACRHIRHGVAQCGSDMHALWLEHLERESSSQHRQPLGKSSEGIIYRDVMIRKDVMIASVILPTNSAVTPVAYMPGLHIRE